MKSPESSTTHQLVGSSHHHEPGQHRSRSATTRIVATPTDTNPSGDIFGGWVLAQMDIAGAITASKRAQGKVVTTSIDGMSFIKPVHVGDILGVYTTITRTGRTSMDIFIDAWVRRNQIGIREKVTQATFTFVSVDKNGKPAALPLESVLPEYDSGGVC